jgi:hypothetical protein
MLLGVSFVSWPVLYRRANQKMKEILDIKENASYS